MLPFFVICYSLCFNIYFGCCNNWNSSCLWISILMEYLFLSSYFQPVLSLALKWVSSKQHIYGSCFAIYSTICVFCLKHVLYLQLRYLFILFGTLHFLELDDFILFQVSEVFSYYISGFFFSSSPSGTTIMEDPHVMLHNP